MRVREGASVREENGFIYFKKGENKGFRLPGYEKSYFFTEEFECHCVYPECQKGEQKVAVELIRRLCELREKLMLPILVRSGYRCSRHQADLREGGLKTASGTSTHELGCAADVMPKEPESNLPSKATMKRFLMLAEGLFKSIGVAKSFLHVDLRDDKKRRWTYS